MNDPTIIEYDLDSLASRLVPTKWHGAHIIFVQGVRAAFDVVRDDVRSLIADNQRLYDNETSALDRMTRAENRANLADATVRRREEEIAYLRDKIALLRAMLSKVEWVEDGVSEYCLWCSSPDEDGHKPDCPWLKAMGISITCRVAGTLEAA